MTMITDKEREFNKKLTALLEQANALLEEYIINDEEECKKFTVTDDFGTTKESSMVLLSMNVSWQKHRMFGDKKLERATLGFNLGCTECLCMECNTFGYGAHEYRQYRLRDKDNEVLDTYNMGVNDGDDED